MEHIKIFLSPPIALFTAAKGRKKHLYWNEAYTTDTIVNGRVLVRSVVGNMPAGWLLIRYNKE